jgi:hypothetical protein
VIRSLLACLALACVASAQTIMVTTNNYNDLNPERDAVSGPEGSFRITHTVTDGASPQSFEFLEGEIKLRVVNQADLFTNSFATAFVTNDPGTVRWTVTNLQAGTYSLDSDVVIGGDTVKIFWRYLTVTQACNPCAGSGVTITITNITSGGSSTNVTGPNVEANSPGYYALQGGNITGATVTVGSAVVSALGSTNIAIGGVRAMLEGESSGAGTATEAAIAYGSRAHTQTIVGAAAWTTLTNMPVEGYDYGDIYNPTTMTFTLSRGKWAFRGVSYFGGAGSLGFRVIGTNGVPFTYVSATAQFSPELQGNGMSSYHAITAVSTNAETREWTVAITNHDGERAWIQSRWSGGSGQLDNYHVEALKMGEFP